MCPLELQQPAQFLHDPALLLKGLQSLRRWGSNPAEVCPTIMLLKPEASQSLAGQQPTEHLLGESLTLGRPPPRGQILLSHRLGHQYGSIVPPGPYLST